MLIVYQEVYVVNVLARIAMKNYLPDMVMKENMDLPIIVIPEEPVLKYVTWLYCINWQSKLYKRRSGFMRRLIMVYIRRRILNLLM